MGIRFRKSFKIAPGVKVNLNKKSTSVTLGEKGVHYTINSKGERTKSIGLPGTGLYYTETTGKKTKNKRSEGANEMAKNNKKKKKTGCLIPIAVIILFFVLLSLIPSDKGLTSVNISADTDTIYNISDLIPISVESDPSDIDIPNDSYKSTGGSFDFSDDNVVFSSSTHGSYDIWIEDGDVKSNILTLSIEDKVAAEQAAAEQAAAEQAAAEQAAAEQAAAEQSQQPQEQMVWIPQSGSKYHSDPSCSGMDNPTQITISEAQAMGYEPCKKCY